MIPDKTVAVIPARYESSRFPGKPLALIAGKPMIRRVFDQVSQSSVDEVLVATDDQRIVDAVAECGGQAVMTSPAHPSGTDRLAEVIDSRSLADDDVIVNLQGDEPLMDPALITAVAMALHDHPQAGMSTIATPIRDARDLFDENVVKVVLDDRGFARYFSRAPIPWVRGAFSGAAPDQLPEDIVFLRHLGLYGYRAGILRQLAAATPVAAEKAESLEQLRALTIGIDIHVSIAEKAPGHGVDTEQDLHRVERELAGKSSGS